MVSITLDVGFCIEALDNAKDVGKPKIFNTDQGSQFTSKAFREMLEGSGIKINMMAEGEYTTTYL